MFKVMIQGKTIKDLRENLIELENALGVRVVQTELATPAVQQDFLTQAAEEPTLPTLSPISQPLPLVTEISQLPASVASATASPNPTGANDSKGMPWDERIHASSRATTKDGSWRYKRGVEETQIRAVEYELIAKIKGAQGGAMAPAPMIPPIPAVIPPPAPLMPKPEPALPSAHTAETFKKLLVPTLAKLVKDGKLTQDYVTALKNHFGVEEIHKVSDAQAEEMFNNFVQYGMIAKAE